MNDIIFDIRYRRLSIIKRFKNTVEKAALAKSK